MEVSLGAPKSVGCFVSWEDFPRICASLSVYGACLGFGAGLASLGASVPELASSINIDDTSIGHMFVFRGVGFLGGAFLSTKLLRIKLPVSKHVTCCIAVIIAGISLALVPFFASFVTIDTAFEMKFFIIFAIWVLFLFEGMCFGTIDAFSALSISEMWGQRTQPWMQAKNLFANFGCLLGPMLVSQYRYETAFFFIGAISCTSVVGIIIQHMSTVLRHCMGMLQQDSNVQCDELGAMELTIDAIEAYSSSSECGGSSQSESNEWDDVVYRVLDEVQQNQLQSKQKGNHNNSNCISYSPVRKTVFDFSSAAMSPRKRQWVENSPFPLLEAQQPQHVQQEERQALWQQEAQQQGLSSPRINPTLSFASPALARKVRTTRKPVGIVLVPFKVRLLLALFVFWELGLMCSFGGWIGTYVSDLQSLQSVDSEATYESVPEGSESQVGDMGFSGTRHWGYGGGSLSTQSNNNDNLDHGPAILNVFYALQIVSSVASIPASVVFSTSTLLRFQLCLAVLAGATLCLSTRLEGERIVYNTISASAGLMGMALGCMYPLAMTIVNDYGATMTSNSTIAVVMGGCIGEATAPFIVAVAIAHFGPAAFPASVFSLIVAMVVTYLALHVYLKYTSVVQYNSNVDKVSRQGGSPEMRSSNHRVYGSAGQTIGDYFGNNSNGSRTATPTDFPSPNRVHNSSSWLSGSSPPQQLVHQPYGSNELTPLVVPARSDSMCALPQSHSYSQQAHSPSLHKNSFKAPSSAYATNSTSAYSSHGYDGVRDESL